MASVHVFAEAASFKAKMAAGIKQKKLLARNENMVTP
jgi:hypothetical protein